MQGQSRVIIENIEPVVSDRKDYAKRVQYDHLYIAADLFAPELGRDSAQREHANIK
jgi:hypothetical protein